MSIVLGVDIGSSMTKMVACEGDRILALSDLIRNDSSKSIDDEIIKFMSKKSLHMEKLSAFAVTGVGTSEIGDMLLNKPVSHHEEFASIIRGGIALAHKKEAVVVSMGTGTAFIRADDTGQFRHLGGSGLGGGMLLGLGKKLYGIESFSALENAVENGDISKIDLRISDLTQRQIGSLPSDVTAANFAKIEPDAKMEDIMLGFANMLIESIAVMSSLACLNDSCNTVVLTGGLTALTHTQRVFDAMHKLNGITFIIPPNATHATALGAVLSSI